MLTCKEHINCNKPNCNCWGLLVNAYHWVKDRPDAGLCLHHYNHGRTVKPTEDVSGSERILGGLGSCFFGTLTLLLLRIFNGIFNLLVISWKSNTTDSRNPEDGCRIPCLWKKCWTLGSAIHYQRRTGDNLGYSANEIMAFKGLRGLRKARSRARSQDFQSADLRLLRKARGGLPWETALRRKVVQGKCLNRELDKVIQVHHRTKMFRRS